jgi:hypothetical protein
MRTSRVGLELHERLSYEQWIVVGKRLSEHVDASCWWLGDWLLFGESRYGAKYTQAIASTGLGYKTLRNYAVVARRFTLSRRRDKVSFQHHAEVCSLSDADQESWLSLAQRCGWSRAELRRRLRAAQLPAQQAREALHVVVAQAQTERWRRAASHDECDLIDWVVRVLDVAADRAIARVASE